MIKICKNRGKDIPEERGYFCKFYEQLSLYYYEDMIVDCEGWE